MEIIKASWTADGDNTRLTMPISKVDTENRLVSGWASLDNVDTQDDVILPEANRNAFTRFRGNIREMHQPIAVGRMVDFREDVYYDTKSEKFYNGIYVTVYVSKGAQATWEKVLDGTLQGFSIGGSILDAEQVFMKDMGKPVRVVKDYELIELSLVDSPANQLANVFSITKSADGMTMKGMVVETPTENVYYCRADGVAKTSTEDSAVCPEGHAMENIGWFENDGEDKAEKVQSIISSYHSASVAKQAEPAPNNEGGVNVAEDTKNEASEEVVAGSSAPAVDAVSEEGKAESEVKSSATATEEVTVTEEKEVEVSSDEKAADVSEVEADEPDFAKMFGNLQTAIESGLEKSRTETTEAISKATETFETRFTELLGKHEELTTKFADLEAKTVEVEKSLQAVEADTAVKKSGDLGGSTEDSTLAKSKSGWGGHFLRLTDLQ